MKPTNAIQLYTWADARIADLHRQIRSRLAHTRSERGATTLEYAVIAGAIIVVAIGLAALIATAVSNHSSSIQ